MLLAGLVHVNALDNPFVYDDARLILENRSLLDVTNVGAIILHEVTRPAVNMSYAIDRAVWGPAPFGFHVTNVLLHMINVGLLFLLAWRLTEDAREKESIGTGRFPLRPSVVAFTAASLFAVHPMMTQAVGYISGRSEVLCASFFLLALMSARKWMRRERLIWLVPTAAFWVLATASREIAPMFPFVVLLYDRLVARSTGAAWRRRLVRLHLPLFAIAMALIAVRLAVFTLIEYSGVTAHWPFVLVELDVIRRYLTLMILPVGQTIFHAILPIRSVVELRALMGAATVGLVLLVAWRVRRREGLVSFGLLWFLLLLIPSSVLVVLDRGEPMAEHRVYLASCGLFLTIGAVLSRCTSWFRRATLPARLILRIAAAVGLIWLGSRTVLRNVVWADPVVLWSEAAEKAPDHWLPQLLLGEALHTAGRHAEAVVPLSIALRLRPQELSAYSKLGVCLIEIGRLEEASMLFEKLQSMNPRSAQASNGLGTIALLRRQAQLARERFSETLTRDPRNIEARRGLAALEETIGANPAAALRYCEEIKQLTPESADADRCIARNRARIGGTGSSPE